MKTNALLLGIGAMIVLAMAGCGGPAESAASKNDGAPAERAKAQQDQFERLKPRPIEKQGDGGAQGN